MEKIFDIINHNIDVENILVDIINNIHRNGPKSLSEFEILTYIKIFHTSIFEKYEQKLLFTIGLFYKTSKPETLLDEIYSIFRDVIQAQTSKKFTPVQAHAYQNIKNKRYFSFSAPTSAGKSYLFQTLLSNADFDIVIVVPSRALIAEYLNTVKDLVGKDVLVLPFIDNLNLSKISRRIFIITPERGIELFKNLSIFNIQLFLLDEAQISEEPIRGLKFDAFIRRIDKLLPDAKKVFAHPFVDNPDAQLLKHNFPKDTATFMRYDQNTVGKIFLSYNSKGFSYFSPYHQGRSEDILFMEKDIVEDTLLRGGTLLVYIAKSKLYNGEYISDFGHYIDLCPPIKNKDALNLIETLKNFIGANDSDKSSLLISMMERGIVIHHGSIPLNARLIIEQFIKKNYAKICFATATLIQGINMPFDLVWIDNFKNLNPLNLKNLIGRSGRTTSSNPHFEYGYTIVKEQNVSTFCKRLNVKYELKTTSQLDQELLKIQIDTKDIIEAVQNNSFNDEYHLTNSQIERLQESSVDTHIEYILQHFIIDGSPISGKAYYELGDSVRQSLKNAFKQIYISHLQRGYLTKSEQSILSTAIPIMLWHIQGKSFSEIVALRHSFITNKSEIRKILSQLNNKEISPKAAQKTINSIPLRYSPIASSLPNISLKGRSLFDRGATYNDFDFDTLVFDTYDYIDKVVSLSLADPLCAAFQLYFEKTQNKKALSIANYIRYSTDNLIEIWLLRYGFSFEDIAWIIEYIEQIDENGIVFKKSVTSLPKQQYLILERYM